MSEISKNKRWTSFTLDELFDFASGRAIEASESGEYPVFGSNGEIGRTDHPTIENVIILGRVGAYCGSVQLSEQKSAATDNTIICKPKRKESHELLYLYYLLQTCNLNKFAGGSAQPLLTQNFLKPIEVIVPSDDLKEKIVKVLTSFDDLIENNSRRIKILEESAKTLYREWFVHYRYPGHENDTMVDSELGPIPKGWKIKCIEDLCSEIKSGSTPRRSEERFWSDHHMDWYKTGELQDDFLFGSNEGISEEALEKARVFPSGTILMAIYGSPTVGRLGILTIPSSCNQAALGLNANLEVVTSEFLYYKLWELRGYFNTIAQGAAQQNISKEKVSGTLVQAPPVALLKEFSAIAEKLMELISVLTKQNFHLTRSRDLLLPRLISGELDVSNLDLVA